jgi:hypothetical protein
MYMRIGGLGGTSRSVPYLSVARVVLIVALLTSAGSSCFRPAATEQGLNGEWEATLRFTPPGSEAEPALITGRVVFDPQLPHYGVEMPPRVILGRAYLDLSTPIRSGEVRNGPHYAGGDDADLVEEINAIQDPAGRFTIEISPQIFGRDPVLTATRDGDTMTGEWTYFSHTDTVGRGTFIMKRVRPSQASDSALSRARRAAQRWTR